MNIFGVGYIIVGKRDGRCRGVNGTVITIFSVIAWLFSRDGERYSFRTNTDYRIQRLITLKIFVCYLKRNSYRWLRRFVWWWIQFIQSGIWCSNRSHRFRWNIRVVEYFGGHSWVVVGVHGRGNGEWQVTYDEYWSMEWIYGREMGG